MHKKYLLLSLFVCGIAFAAGKKLNIQQPKIDHDGFHIPLPPQRFRPTPERVLNVVPEVQTVSKFVYVFGTNPLTGGTLFHLQGNQSARAVQLSHLNDLLQRRS